MVKFQAKQNICCVGCISICFFVLAMQPQIKVCMDEYIYNFSVNSRKFATYIAKSPWKLFLCQFK